MSKIQRTENEKLDGIVGVSSGSRLACQAILGEEPVNERLSALELMPHIFNSALLGLIEQAGTSAANLVEGVAREELLRSRLTRFGVLRQRKTLADSAAFVVCVNLIDCFAEVAVGHLEDGCIWFWPLCEVLNYEKFKEHMQVDDRYICNRPARAVHIITAS